MLIRPGDLSPKFIDLSWWLLETFGTTAGFELADELVTLKVTDLKAPAVFWPNPAVEVPVYPLEVGAFFSIKSAEATKTSKSKAFGFTLVIDAPLNATVGSVLRIDYQFEVSNACGTAYRGTGCTLAKLVKCL